MEPAINSTFGNWTLPFQYCCNFLYALSTNFSGTGDASCIFLASQTSPTIQIYTSNFSDVRIYNVTLIGTLPSSAKGVAKFSIDVRNPCDYISITAPNYTSGLDSFIFSYIIQQEKTQIQMPSFNFSNPICILNVTLTNNDFTPYPSSFITNWNMTSQNITVFTDNNTFAGLYNLTLTASFQNGNSFTRVNITLNIQDQCTGSVISSFPVDLIYSIPMKDPIYYAFFFSQSLAIFCIPITYSLTNALTGGAIDQNIFNFISSDTLSIFGNSLLQLGTHRLTIKACIGDFVCISEPMTVTFNPKVDCSTPHITTSSIPSQKYTVNSPILYIKFNEWKEVTGLCGEISYYYTASSKGSGNPGIIAFSTTSRTFSIFTTSNNDVDVYTVSIIGAMQMANYVLKFTITVNPFICNVISMSAPSKVKKYTYYIAQETLSIQVPSFVQNPECQSPVSLLFGLIVNGVMTSLPSFIIPTTTKKYLLVKTTTKANVGNYTLYVQGYVINADRSQPKSIIQINLQVLWPSMSSGAFSSQNTAPYFRDEPQDIYATAFVLFSYRLPVIEDQQGDMVLINPNFYGTRKFAYLSNHHIIVNASNEDVGIYPIVIKLEEFKSNSKWRDYQITLTVLKGSYPGMKPTAIIKTITPGGLVTVLFDTALKVPSQWKFVGVNQLLIRIKNQIGYRNLKFTWHIVSFTYSYMLIQLLFQDKMLVSNDISNPELFDSVEITFLDQTYFSNMVTNILIMQNYTTEGTLPRQYDSVDHFEEITQATTSADLYYKILVATTTSISTISQLPNPVWPLVYSLQLVSHMSLATENTPYNAVHFLKAIKILSNFDYFKAFNFSDASNLKYFKDRGSRRLETNKSTSSFSESNVNGFLEPRSFEFQKMGYETQNQILDLRSIFYYSMFLVYTFIALLVLKIVSSFTQIKPLSALYQFLSDIFFFDFMIRYVTVFYMEYTLTSLISILQLSFESPQDFATSVHSIIFLLITMILPLLSIILVITYNSEMSSVNSRTNFEALHKLFKQNLKARLFYPFFLLRRQLMCIAIVSFDKYRTFQLHALILINNVGRKQEMVMGYSAIPI